MKNEVIENLSALITAAFGLVAALAWNDTIKKIFEHFYAGRNSIWAMIVYAIIVTIIAVTASIWIGKIEEKAKLPIKFKKILRGKKKKKLPIEPFLNQ